MSETLLTFMGEDTHEPRDRLGTYLRRQFSDGFAVKRLSRALRCTPKAAENILAGTWPNSRHFQRIVQIFGQDVLDAVFGPDIDATVARLKREEAELERLLAEKRARRLQAEGVGAGAPKPTEATAPVEPRTFRPRVVR